MRPAQLPYLEFHLTDHCNLNCAGCTHYCPIAGEGFLSMATFLKDMTRLSEIFTDIARIRIMGGEPLLHPSVALFAGETRRFFPESSISIVTNGILLPSMGADFYGALLENDIALDVSAYPATEGMMRSHLFRAYRSGVPIRLSRVGTFERFVNSAGDSDGESAFRRCRVNRHCTFLRNGRIYHCCMPALADVPNGAFGLGIPGGDCVDIHADVTADGILDYLKRPSAACAWCGEAVRFPWRLSRREREEWVLGKAGDA